jgi:HAE1 family hydrophobic/amphiphilic exporter-1
VTAIMVFVVLIVLGFVSYSKMPLDLYPEIEFPYAIVITGYPNVGSKEVESNVTRPLEESLAGINNVDEITSTSKEGISLVSIKFTWGTDMSLAVADMRERIDIVKGFLPDEVDTPIVLKFDTSMIPIMVLSVSGSTDLSYLRKYAEDTLKSLIEQTDGVASANVIGGQDEEVQVELIKNRMDAYNLSIDRLIQILAMENLNVPGGDIKTPMKKYSLRTEGEFKSIADIRNVVVDVKNGVPVHVRDVARVYMGYAERSDIVRLNGDNGVIIRINKQSDKNTVIVAKNLFQRIDEINKTLPRGIEIVPIFNSAEYIQNSIANVVDNAIIGGIIAIFVVFVFLRNIRASLILGLSIPISIITTFVVMYYFDLSLNLMSMGGLAIGVGMLIDNSIVILENIFRFRDRGARPIEAAKLGADEMGMAITASTLTTVSVFLPFLFTEGLAGQLFKDMALTITFSLLCSLFVALTLIPMMTSRYIKTLHRSYTGRLSLFNGIFDRSERALKGLEDYYVRVLPWALGRRKRVVAYKPPSRWYSPSRSCP